MPPAATLKANPDVVRALRVKDGWSIAAFAREIEIAPSHLSNFEAGRDGVSLAIVKNMSRVLNIPLSILTARTDPTADAA